MDACERDEFEKQEKHAPRKEKFPERQPFLTLIWMAGNGSEPRAQVFSQGF
jgi:hypothetical protein